MPVSVVVGGQFGSEGKGKVACWLSLRHQAAGVVRVGGSNSGHTVVDSDGERRIFRHLPTAAILPDVKCFLGAGSYIDPDVFDNEIRTIDLDIKRIVVDPNASVITQKHKRREAQSDLRDNLASTLSGTGACVQDRISRNVEFCRAADHPKLARFVGPVKRILRDLLESGERIVIEGTQGYGLSLLHSDHYPYTTSRDTTAAAFLSEAGVGLRDVDQVVMVLRAFPIRVGGPSGPLPREIDWQTVTEISGSPTKIQERTSVTNTVRRVAHFDPTVVRDALRINQPTHLVLNHLDHVDYRARAANGITDKVLSFVRDVEEMLRVEVDYLGFGPETDALVKSPLLEDSGPRHPSTNNDHLFLQSQP